MLFMVMHKVDAHMEAGLPPSRKIIDEMGKLVGESIQNGVFQNGGGLKRSAERIRLRFKDGKREIIKGPLQGGNELIAGFGMMQVKSMEEAIHWSTRFAEVIGDVEIDVGPLVEPWDLGIVPKPEGELPLRVMAAHKADKDSEADVPPSPELMAKMGALMAEMGQAGVMLGGEGLKSSRHGARLIAKAGNHTWTDGPFTESKELIAGFSIIKVDSLAAAKAWTTRYANILGDTEVDIRQISEG